MTIVGQKVTMIKIKLGPISLVQKFEKWRSKKCEKGISKNGEKGIFPGMGIQGEFFKPPLAK